MPDFEYSLTIKAGRIICPASSCDMVGAVAVRDKRIAAVASDLHGTAQTTLNFPDAVLLPGLIDLHAHPARDGSKYGVDPDEWMLPRGVTTVLSQGDAGASNWPAYRDDVLRKARTRIRMAINLSVRGESMPEGCFENLADCDVDACVATIAAGGESIWGIAVNVSEIACGQTDPRAVLKLGLEAAEQTGKPLLYGVRRPTLWPYDEQLAWLRPGDVITYCYRGGDWSVVDNRGRIHPAVRAARARGVLFDVGHGTTAFDFKVAEAAVADGFPPDTISSDLWRRHLDWQPRHDLPRTLSKLIAIGMPENEAFAAVTSRPAKILGLDSEIGSLAVGTCADLSVIQFNTDAPPLTDHNGIERGGGCWEPVVTVRAGELIWSSSSGN